MFGWLRVAVGAGRGALPRVVAFGGRVLKGTRHGSDSPLGATLSCVLVVVALILTSCRGSAKEVTIQVVNPTIDPKMLGLNTADLSAGYTVTAGDLGSLPRDLSAGLRSVNAELFQKGTEGVVQVVLVYGGYESARAAFSASNSAARILLFDGELQSAKGIEVGEETAHFVFPESGMQYGVIEFRIGNVVVVLAHGYDTTAATSESLDGLAQLVADRIRAVSKPVTIMVRDEGSATDAPAASPEMHIGAAILDASRRSDTQKLLSDYTVTDISEVSAVLSELGREVPTGQELADAKQENERLQKSAIDMYLQSYESLFGGQLVKVETRPIHVVPVTGDSKVVDEALTARFGPKAVILWVKKDGKYRGIFIPQLLSTQSGLRVALWIGGVPLYSYASGAEITAATAVLERSSLESCDFPSAIDFETQYRDGSRGRVTATPGELGILESEKLDDRP